MILKVYQTRNFPTSIYEVKNDDVLKYVIEQNFSQIKYGFTLSGREKNVVMTSNIDYEIKFKNKLPFRWVFGGSTLSNPCRVEINHKKCANFISEKNGIMKTRYVIQYNNINYYAYFISQKEKSYVTILKDDKIQVALIEKSNYVKNNLDDYLLYLQDEYQFLEQVLLLFCGYFDNIEYGEIGDVQYGTTYVRKCCRSRYKNKLNLAWLEENFKTKKQLKIG